MRLVSAHIDGFGKFVNRDFTFGEGLNIIYGLNEDGKTTLNNFLEAMLFGPQKKSKNFGKSVYDAMEPWDEKAVYRGTLTVEFNGKTYEIRRDFRRECESFAILDTGTGFYHPEPEKLLSEMLGGLTPAQLTAHSGQELSREIRGFLENLGTTGNPDLSAEKAAAALSEKKASLEAELDPDAAKEYTVLLGRIKNIEAELSDPENENKVLEFRNKDEKLSENISHVENTLLNVESELTEDSRTLSDHHLRFRDDVTALDEKADTLYEEWQELLEKKKSAWKIVGIVLFAVITAAAAAVYFLLPGYRQLAVFAGSASLFLLIVFILIRVIAGSKFKKKNRELSDFMYSRSGDTEVTEASMDRLRQEIHSLDDVITRQEQNQQEKEELTALRDALTGEQRDTRSAIDTQYAICEKVDERLSEENSLRFEATRLKDVIAKNNQLKKEIDAIDIAIDTINDLAGTFRDRMGTYLNDEASRILEGVTGGRYRGIDLGDGTNIVINTKNGMIDYRALSSGAVEQVMLSYRLAATRFMMQDAELPLIFDDRFNLYDDERLKSTLSYLSETEKGQVIIFTCQKREVEEAKELGANIITL